MDDLFAPESAPLPPDPPDLRPPDPALGPQPAAVARGTRRPPRSVGGDLDRLVRLLYSHNPFYCLSAFLVLWGLGKSFQWHAAAPRPELLMAGLAGYALLLAAVGCLLIRGGQLWEDIRTILLLIVLIFLAISMSFDELLSTDLAAGRLYFLGGLAFSVIVSELVLRGVRLRLPVLYRLPYYALLAVFFLYPLLLDPWQNGENDPRLRWLLAGFSPLAGLLTLTLLPAVRRGANYVRDNGSPWQWPWYPWPLFVVLGVGVGLRSYALCVSFHPSQGPATMFEPYFLVPFLLAINILLLEIGITSRRPELLRWVMAAPLGLLWLSTWTFGVPESINLRPMLLDLCGCSPLFLTLLAVTGLYVVALARRVPHAFHWLTMAMALFVVVGPSTVGFGDPLVLRAWPLALLAAICAVYGYWVRNGWYLAVALLILAGWITKLGGRLYGLLHATIAGLDQIALGLACLLLGLLVSLWKLGVPQAWWERWLRPPKSPVRSAGPTQQGE